MNTQKIIVKPIISEKSLKEAVGGKYTFKVAQYATKDDIRREVENLFSVHVTRVFTSIVKGSRIRTTRKGRSVTDLTYKKARVALKSGEKISIFEQTEGENVKKA